MYVAWNIPEQQRGFAVRLRAEHENLFRHCDELEDIGLTVQPVGNNGFYLVIQLREAHHQEIFSVLAEDLITGVANISDESSLVQALLNRLVQWEALFKKLGAQGLTPEAQRGLYGELYFLRRLIAAGLTPVDCVEAWVGPLTAVQDFQRNTWATEVKTTAGNNHQKLRISSNRQLDDTGLDTLFLYHLSLDVRPGGSSTLNALVDSVATDLATDAAALGLFETRLQTGGYLREHAAFYAGTGYTIRSEAFYQIGAGFPRITEATTPAGVGDVSYTIVADSCRPWATNWATLTKQFSNAQAV